MNFHFLRTIILVTLLGFVYQTTAQAHASRENYVWINVESDHISGRFEVNVNDVRSKLNIDIDESGETRLEGVLATAKQVQAYLSENFTLSSAQGPVAIEFQEAAVFEGNTDFLQYPFKTEGIPEDNLLSIKNTIFLTPEYIRQDRLHRSMVVIEYNRQANLEFGDENVAQVFTPKTPTRVLNLVSPSSILEWDDFLYQGVLHIAFGFDHVLFVIVLLLTTVLQRSGTSWKPILHFRSALWKTLKIITIFTIAHSITLSLAALDLVNVRSSVVESIIALSILAMALNNVFPRYSAHSWLLIFIFGLFHGLGFASVMGDLQFRNVFIERILILFNIGVEVGQFIIVLIVFPILYALRKNRHYIRWIVQPISACAGLLALFWLFTRMGVIS